MAERTSPKPISDLEHAIAARLRSEIAVQNVKKTELAGQLNVHRTHLSRVIHGRAHIDVNLLDEICRLLGLNMTAVMSAAQEDIRPVGAVVKEHLLDRMDEKSSPERPAQVSEKRKAI